ncbi:Autophagy protein Apg9 family protein [Candida albicans]|uniref:Autophagy-related protein 9 n=1 Tax=Candida albicans TaxID=5476 RepID=A0A8H6C3C4_CANAX|nr:Autophagy protein Apg9 family protein [Candida albicans]
MSSSSYNPYKNNVNDRLINNSTDSFQDNDQGIPNNNDTFLSRIFGLNSIYNQLQDNYQYYDPEFDSSLNQQLQQSIQENDEAEDENLPQQQRASATVNTNYQRTRNNNRRFIIPPKERALYLWANITNMDEFLSDVYYYYRGRGLLNIVLSRGFDLIILIFILIFTVFLKWGIDYSIFFDNLHQEESKHITLNDMIIPNYFATIPLSIKFILFGFSVYILLRSVQLYLDYNYKLKELKNFYHYLLDVTDDELMTISWKTIVEKLMLLKDYNSLTSTTKSNNFSENHYVNDLSSKVRLNAHDIANRIMRRENYMIALINKDILDLSVLFMNEKSLLTKTLEWNLKLCIDNFIYNQQGQINGKILKEYNRNQLARELTSRFKLAAIINLILSPFIVIYFVLLYFFRYFNEYKSNPASILGLRQYTPYAEWKLREYNELSHLFNKRLIMSMGPANTYIDQFPKGFLVVNLMRLINFISGSILAVLVIMGILLEDENHSFWSFEITDGRSALFYISIFGTIWAITASSATASTFVYDPEASLRYVAQFTHYLPSSWNKKLHTIQVKNEFCQLYCLKIIIIINEILSSVLTPFILWFKISHNSGNIIDFYREYSIHVDGLGYVCYFAMFNFEEKDKNMMSDLNKSKKRRKRMKNKMNKYGKTKMVNPISGKTVNSEIEMTKISKSESERSSDDESGNEQDYDNDEELDYLSYKKDDKMIKSYMYFLESYGGSKQPQPQPPQQQQHPQNQNQTVGGLRNRNPIQSIDPAIMTGNYYDQQSLNSSIYNINYKFDDSGLLQDETMNSSSRKKGGVLGMLNQFYKQDINR